MKKPTIYPKNRQISPSNPNVSAPNIQVTESISFASPLLPPKILEDYNKLIPTFAQDMHKEVGLESAHRRSNENWLVKGKVIGSFVAQVFALIVCVYILYIVYQLALADKTAVAAVLGGLDIVAVASVFLATSYINAKKDGDDGPSLD